MTRWTASAVHLGVSLIIATVVIVFMRSLWYPGSYFQLMGSGLFRILIPVDIVMGPLLTLIVFKRGKPSLRFDLSVIATMQLAALCYGLYVVYVARPVYIVFAMDHFEIVAANEVVLKPEMQSTDAQFPSLPLDGPHLVAAKLPDDAREREQLMFSALQGQDVHVFPKYFVAYKDQLARVLEKSKPLSALPNKTVETAELVADLERDFGSDAQSLGYLPGRYRKGDFAAVINRKSGAIVRLLPMDVWT